MVKYGYCPECSKNASYRPERINPWTTRVQKCRRCGSGLFERDDVLDTLIDTLRTEIAELEEDEECKIGLQIANEIATSEFPEEVIFAKLNLEDAIGRKMLDKATMLSIKSKKLEKLSKRE